MPDHQTTLSRRERQIMDILYSRGRATASEILEAMTDPPTNATIRTLLRILETKGHVRHETDGTRFVFFPAVARGKAKRSAMRHLVQTFFEGSPSRAVAALLDSSDLKLSAQDADRLKQLIDEKRGGEE
jgi:predicted transcriptional regulator